MLEEVVALVIYNDEGREVLHANLTNGLHAQLWEIYHLYALDAVLGKDGSRTANRAKVE